MKKCLRTIVILLAALLLSGCAKQKEAAEFEPCYRFDVGGPTAWKEPLKNVRFLKLKCSDWTRILCRMKREWTH